MSAGSGGGGAKLSFFDALRKNTDIPAPADKPKMPSPASRAELDHNKPLFDYYIVLDFEATCERDIRIRNQEIIEFPSVLVDAHTTTVVAEFQRYVRPVINPTLSGFCVELTGIQQSTVDAAQPFPEVWREYNEWIAAGSMGTAPPAKSFAFVTCGDWDLKTMLPIQMSYHKELRVPAPFTCWINIKKVFERVRGVSVRGMPDMLTNLKKPLLGHHHSGIDDCRNIATILIELLRQGASVDFTQPPAGSYTHWVGSSATPPPSMVVRAPSFRVETAPAASNSTYDEAIARQNAAAPTVSKAGALQIVEGRDPLPDLMGAKAGRAIGAQEIVSLSKRLSWALRHGISELGLAMTTNGFVALGAIISHPRFKGLDEYVVAQIVANNDKKRFALAYGNDGLVYIRANQGHSIQGVEIDMRPVKSADEIPCAVHGTYYDAWEFIKKEGLNKMKRQHIHFAKGLPGDKEVISGMRTSAEILVYVDIGAMLADGIPVFESANGVILTPGDKGIVAPKYFKEVRDAKTGAPLKWDV